ncbi:MAG: GNAT family N-acetyltransferase [Rikenellaceae bacterium]
MVMEIIHDKQNNRFYTEAQGYTAYVGYEILGDTLNITTTQVPKSLSGQGIAAALVEATYDYAAEEELKPAATCSYAVAWLSRHTKS